MNRSQRYLVALANSEKDALVLQYARLLAEHRLGREFHFVHVAPKQEPPHLVHVFHPQESSDHEFAQRVEREFGEPPEGVSTQCHLLAGARVDALLEFAVRYRSDVILLGHRSERSGQRSLARRLAMISPASVWLVPEGAPVSLTKVLAPVDFSDHSRDSLEVATSICRAAPGSSCLALHVYFDESTVRYPEHIAAERAAERGAFESFLEEVDTHGVNVENRIEESSLTARTILRVAEEESADLIVMNTRGRSRAAAILLGSITTQVMIETHVAVFAVKHYGAAMGLFQVLRDSHFWHRSLPKSN